MKNHQKKPIQNDQSTQVGNEDINYIETVQALARMTYKSIYILNHQSEKFEYVSDNPLFCCGFSPQEVKAMGFDFYNRCILVQEREMLTQIAKAGFSFFSSLPIEERKNYTLSFDIHLIHHLKHTTLIHHEMTPLLLTATGKLWKSICIVSLSTASQSGNIKIFKVNSPILWMYTLERAIWEEQTKPKLSHRELEIIQYAFQGYTIQEIAALLYLSTDTIKFHRRKVLEKLQVSTIAKAIRFAIVHKLL